MRFLDDRRFRRAFAVLALFTTLAGDAWRYSMGWLGYGIIAAILAIAAIALIIRERSRWSFNRLPYPLLAFFVLTVASLAWSFYPGATALGIVATWMTVAGAFAIAICFPWPEIVFLLSRALRIILGLSLVFELVVALFVRHPVLPLVPAPGVDYNNLDKVPKLLYWSRDVLFEGGKIQGIVGNSSLLAFLALLGLIVFGVQLASRSVLRVSGVMWVALAAFIVILTRSATIIVAIVVLAAVLLLVLLIRRARGRRDIRLIAAGTAVVVAASIAAVSLFPTQLLALLGKSPDLTNRLDIWAEVTNLAVERPAFGWGWVSYWVPWVAPFDTLAFNSGVRQLHAHNAWLDLWLQLGVAGLIVFGALVLSTLVRAFALATDRPMIAPLEPAPFSIVAILPLLILVALLVQSIAESRLIVEYGIFLLAIIAIRTKLEPTPVIDDRAVTRR